MFKLLSVGTTDPPSDQASYYTSLATVGCALKYLPTFHTSEPDIHEQAIGLQMATAAQLLPHIQKSLSATAIEVYFIQSLAHMTYMHMLVIVGRIYYSAEVLSFFFFRIVAVSNFLRV